MILSIPAELHPSVTSSYNSTLSQFYLGVTFIVDVAESESDLPYNLNNGIMRW